MSKDLKEVQEKVEVKQVEKKEKKQIRRADIEYRGKIFIDENQKEDGFIYRFVNDKAGRVGYLESLGYEKVVDKNLQVGSGSTSEASRMGSAVTLDVGIHKGSQTAILMRCPKEDFEARKKAQAERNKQLFDEMVDQNQYAGQQQPV